MKKIVWATLLLALAIGVVLSFVAAPSNWDASDMAFRFQLVTSAVTAVLHVGAGTLFIVSLGAYKAKLRQAYIFVALGVVFVALGTLQLPILSWFNLWDSAWVTKGGIILPFLLAGFGLYAGARLLGRLVNAQTVLTKATIVVPAILVLTVLVSLLPHGAREVSELEFDMSNAVLLLDGFFMAAGALIVLRVKNQIGEHYINAMAWLFTAMMTAVTILLLAFLDALMTTNDQDAISHFVTLAAAVAGLVWLRAGYAFAKAKDY